MDIIGGFREKARGKNLSVVLPEGRDERIIQAARRLKDEGIARPIVLGKPKKRALISKASRQSILKKAISSVYMQKDTAASEKESQSQ